MYSHLVLEVNYDSKRLVWQCSIDRYSSVDSVRRQPDHRRPVPLVDMSINMKLAFPQMLVVETLSEFRTAGVLSALGYIADAERRCMGHENVRGRRYTVIYGLAITFLILECAYGEKLRSLQVSVSQCHVPNK